MIIHDYDTEPQPDLRIDVVIPFCQSDMQFLSRCVSAIVESKHIEVIIHCIADGCIFPDLEYNVHRYYTPGWYGPFNITNALVEHLHTPIFAIQDVDDVSHPDRLWKQALALRKYPMTCCAMDNNSEPTYAGDKHINEPVLYPNIITNTTPHGRYVNSTRAIRLAAFKQLNGFNDMIYGGDFEFDNRILPICDCHASMEILATRYHHNSSLSNNPDELKLRQDKQTLYSTLALMTKPSPQKAASAGKLGSKVLYTIN